jgi:predicted ferric reductase
LHIGLDIDTQGQYVADSDLTIVRRTSYPISAVSRRGLSGALVGWILSAIVVANLAAIVWLWLSGGGISSVNSLGTFLTSVGRITGLVGAFLLLVQVLLLARLPFVEHLAGFDRLTVWHRWNGKLCLYLILAHVVFITLGYTLMDRISLSSEITALLGTYPGMVTATVGTVLLVVVALLSYTIVRRRLRYELWYLVHLTAYAGILLAWFHQIPTGNELITNARASAYWTALYLITLLLIVLFRFLQPIVFNSMSRMRVADVTIEGPNVVSLRVTGHHLDRLRARAGQFFLWRFLSSGRWWESHPFSLSEAPDGRSFRITVKNSGDFTRHIGEIKPGTPVIAEGPFGVFTEAVKRQDRVLLIAGGIGITPIRSLLEEMTGDLTLIYRVVREEDLIFKGELEALARTRGITMHFVVGDHRGPDGERLMSPEHLRELVPDLTTRDIYVCGPPALADMITTNVRRNGVPHKQIHMERFAL